MVLRLFPIFKGKFNLKEYICKVKFPINDLIFFNFFIVKVLALLVFEFEDLEVGWARVEYKLKDGLLDGLNGAYLEQRVELMV